ncbi:hypothetical protein C4D60_Mb07t04400 [Musa balbisiana]|uniref:Uncharacterized protein n=1 Tax=Musa balbisiana TaxID=52838 RepID=A0A4S8JD24_MUSBA|nr:hypothetical protein C4D60_Mb07t04400 [Musa balbisiana]
MPGNDGDSSSGSGPNPNANPNSVPKLSNGGTPPQLKRSRTITAAVASGGAAAVGRAATAPLPSSRRLTVAVDNPSDAPANGGVFDRDWYYPSFLGPYAARPRATGRTSSSGPKKLDVPLPASTIGDLSHSRVRPTSSGGVRKQNKDVCGPTSPTDTPTITKDSSSTC